MQTKHYVLHLHTNYALHSLQTTVYNTVQTTHAHKTHAAGRARESEHFHVGWDFPIKRRFLQYAQDKLPYTLHQYADDCVCFM